MVDQSPQGLISSVEKTISIPVESAGAIKSAGCYLAWARLEMVATFAASRLDGESAAKRNVANWNGN